MKKQNKIVLSIAIAIILTNGLNAKDIKSLDTVTVTAQKTEQNIQDVPISMTVFDEFSLQDKMIDDVADIAKYTPGFEIVNNGMSTLYAPAIRGIFSTAGASSVAGLFMDGVPMLKSGFDATLMDIQRVEVLKGPQGTLYGKNAEVGVINIISKKPNNETKGKIKATFGSDNKKELVFSTSGAILKDKFYIGIAGKHYEKDGFIKNTYTNKFENDREHDYGKINLRWTPTDDLELSLISSKIKYNDGGVQIGSIKQNYREVSSNLDTFNKSDIVLNALNISYTINDKLSLTSTTTHTKENKNLALDLDYSSNVSKKLHILDYSTSKSLAEELKLNYENDNIKLVSGIYLENEKGHANKDMDAFFMPKVQYIIEDTSIDSIGLFSHLTYAINDRLSVLGGLRYDKAEQTFEDSTQTIDNDESEISPKIGLTYDLKENMMTYATISKGYRAGGFNTSAPAGYSKTFDKETLYSYEVGLKGSMMEGRLIYDTALYYMDITDMQAIVLYPSTSGFATTNAAKATSQGIETALNFQATDTLNVFTGFSYNDASYDKYNNGKKDFSGKRTTFAPKYNFNLGVLYRADNGYYASADISGCGDTYKDAENKYKIDAYEIVNTKVGYETDEYDIYLYAKNLFDKKFDKVGQQYNTYSDPREIGIQLAYRF